MRFLYTLRFGMTKTKITICSIRSVLPENTKEIKLTFLLTYADVFLHQTTTL